MTMMQSASLAAVNGAVDGAGIDAFHQRGHGRGVAQPRAVVDVVRAEALADELLEQIGFLVRALGRAEAGERVAAMLVSNGSLEPGRGAVERFLPGCFAEDALPVAAFELHVGVLGYAVAADQRLRQAVGMVDVVEAEAALDAQAVVVGRSIAAIDVKDLVVLDVHRGLAADAAIGAKRVDLTWSS